MWEFLKKKNNNTLFKIGNKLGGPWFKKLNIFSGIDFTICLSCPIIKKKQKVSGGPIRSQRYSSQKSSWLPWGEMRWNQGSILSLWNFAQTLWDKKSNTIGPHFGMSPISRITDFVTTILNQILCNLKFRVLSRYHLFILKVLKIALVFGIDPILLFGILKVSATISHPIMINLTFLILNWQNLFLLNCENSTIKF